MTVEYDRSLGGVHDSNPAWRSSTWADSNAGLRYSKSTANSASIRHYSYSFGRIRPRWSIPFESNLGPEFGRYILRFGQGTSSEPVPQYLDQLQRHSKSPISVKTDYVPGGSKR
jgi:hypothetical protein